MAGGGKETPRQKMIGMMYLFLTAMLAINVSDSLLHRFLFINDTLESAKQETNLSAVRFLDKIEQAVVDKGNRDADVAVLTQAQEVRSLTLETMNTLDDLKKYFIDETGGYDSVTNELYGFKDHEFIAHHMIQQKHGEELKNELNQFVIDLSTMVPDVASQLHPIALDGSEHEVYKNDPNQSKKDFSALFFENTPLAAGLATITQFENEVLAAEARALEHLATQVGAQDLDFDKIEAVVRPVSQRVAAGAKYEADLFIAASSSALEPVMFRNGVELPVEEGIGKISFTAQAPSEYDEEGVSLQKYRADIQLEIPGRGDTTFTKEVEYFVVEPVIQVQSQAVSALYFRCGNELSIQVPALGNAYDPSFEVKGGNLINGDQKGLLTIIPTNNNVEVSVLNAGNLIGVKKFGVRRVPKPEIQIQNRGGQISGQQGLQIAQMNSLTAAVIPDEDFKRLLPNDANYRVAEWKITLASGPRPKGAPLVLSGSDANLRSLKQRARAGDRLVIEVTRVERLNYQKQIEVVPISFAPLSIPLH